MYARFLIISISLQVCSSLQHEIVTKTSNFPNKKLVLSESSFDNTTLFYVSCSEPPKQCTVIQNVNPFFNFSTTRKCDVTLQADNVQVVVGFGIDKAIVITQETTGKSTCLRLTLVHMPSCTITDAKIFEIPANWKGTQMYRKNIDVVVFQDGFEVIVKGFSKICDSPDQKTFCSIEFNSDGKRIDGPIIWPKTPYSISNISSPIASGTEGKRYFFIDNIQNIDQKSALIGVQMNRMGGPTFIKLWGPTELRDTYWSTGYSFTNKAHGMCYSDNYIVRCWQKSLQNKVTLRKEFTIQQKHKTWNTYVHNLSEGGFIVLTINCPNRICSGLEDQYYFMKIDAEGKMMGHLDINFQSNCNANNGNILAKVFENEQGLYCAVRLCKSQNQGIGKLETVIHCFSDDHFLKH